MGKALRERHRVEEEGPEEGWSRFSSGEYVSPVKEMVAETGSEGQSGISHDAM